MFKLSGKKSKKMIYFKIYRSKIHITQNFMLIPLQKNFFISIIIFKSNGNGNVNSNGNGNNYLNLAFLAQNGEGTAKERSRNGQKFSGNGLLPPPITVKVQERKNYCNKKMYF